MINQFTAVVRQDYPWSVSSVEITTNSPHKIFLNRSFRSAASITYGFMDFSGKFSKEDSNG